MRKPPREFCHKCGQSRIPLKYKSQGYRCRRCHARGEMYRKARIKFGLTREQLDAMYSSSGGKCAICAKDVDGVLHLDHDHVTGRVRSLLCMGCNTGIGMLLDNPDICESAAKYLRRWNGT